MKKIKMIILTVLILSLIGGAAAFLLIKKPSRKLEIDFETPATVTFEARMLLSSDSDRNFQGIARGRVCGDRMFFTLSDMEGLKVADCYGDSTGVKWDLLPAFAYLLSQYKIPTALTEKLIQVSGLQSVILPQEQIDFLLEKMESWASLMPTRIPSPKQYQAAFRDLFTEKIPPCKAPEQIEMGLNPDLFRFYSRKDDPSLTVGVKVAQEDGRELLLIRDVPGQHGEFRLSFSRQEQPEPVEIPENTLSQDHFDMLELVTEWVEVNTEFAQELIERFSAPEEVTETLPIPEK